jgi:hypothetical protein
MRHVGIVGRTMGENVIVSGLMDLRHLDLDELFPEGGESGLRLTLERILADNPDESTGFQSSI